MAKTLGGIIVPILTPMHADERINEPALRNHIDRMLEGGVHGLFPCGTNGEGYILSEGEKEEVFAICLSQTAGRVPVFAGTGCVGTRDTIRLSRKAADMGADVLSVIRRASRRPPRRSSMRTTAPWQKASMRPSCFTISPPARGMRWPLRRWSG